MRSKLESIGDSATKMKMPPAPRGSKIIRKTIPGDFVLEDGVKIGNTVNLVGENRLSDSSEDLDKKYFPDEEY